MFDPHEINSPSANRPKKVKRKNNSQSGYAGFWKRALSVVIDITLLAIFLKWYDMYGQVLLLQYLQDNPTSWLATYITKIMQTNFSNFTALIMVIAATPVIINNGLFVWVFGGSIGQKMARMTVVNQHNTRIGFFRSMLRLICCYPIIVILPISAKILVLNLSAGMTEQEMKEHVTLTMMMPYLISLGLNCISVLMVIFRSDSRTIHDVLAGTYVIK